MTKPLDQRRGSSRIRGYSRLSYGLTASTTIASARNEIPSRMLTSLDGQTPDWTDMDSYRYDSRSNSRAISLPPNLGKIIAVYGYHQHFTELKVALLYEPIVNIFDFYGFDL